MARAPRDPPRVALLKAQRKLAAVGEPPRGGDMATLGWFAGLHPLLRGAQRAERRVAWESATAKRGAAWGRVLRACTNAIGDAYAGRERARCIWGGHKWVIYARDGDGHAVAAIEVSAVRPRGEGDFQRPVIAKVCRVDLLVPGGEEILEASYGGRDVRLQEIRRRTYVLLREMERRRAERTRRGL